jgi:hypothetical protein
MIFKKNLGPGQRAARFVGGMLMMVCGWFPLHAGPLGLLFVAAGCFSILTGILRYCPVCTLGDKNGGKNAGGC